MIPPAMLVLLAKATIVLVVALGITRALQRAGAGARHLVWFATLAALLLVPALAAWAPLRIAVLPGLSGAPTPRSSSGAALATPTTSTRTDAMLNAIGAEQRAEQQVAQPVSSGAPIAPDVAVSTARRWLGVVPAALALWAVVALAIGGSLATA